MPRWLVNALKWGGPVVVIAFLVPLYVVGPMGPYVGNPPPNAPANIVVRTDQPLWLYWSFLLIGVVGTIVGHLADRSKTSAS